MIIQMSTLGKTASGIYWAMDYRKQNQEIIGPGPC
jgi:hypothetical protein